MVSSLDLFRFPEQDYNEFENTSTFVEGSGSGSPLMCFLPGSDWIDTQSHVKSPGQLSETNDILVP